MERCIVNLKTNLGLDLFVYSFYKNRKTNMFKELISLFVANHICLLFQGRNFEFINGSSYILRSS